MKNMNSNFKNVKASWSFLMAVLLMVVMASCGGDDKVGTDSMISGGSSKTWKASKELTAAGDKDKLTKDEKQETMQFYSDGRFAMGGGGSLETGTWAYDPSGKRLSLTFQDQNVAEVFQVEKLTEKEMHLIGGDGSKMELKAD